jgi:lipopolysaccharide transport system ATP-binding protein
VNAVEFDSVSKSYALYADPGDRLKELLTFHRLKLHQEFWALSDVCFEVKRGEVFCLVGENGSGKSTALQLIAGIAQPTTGTVTTVGRISALLELGSGFDPEFSGRDNVYLNGAVLGFSKREIDARYSLIEHFAEIGEFIDRPVKTYSSGMVVRLAFAVAIHADPEILLVDEALSVGDAYFRQRCMRKVHELRAHGVTILFVSHSPGDVKAVADRALWLERGCVRDIGDPTRVLAAYLDAMAAKDAVYKRIGGAVFQDAASSAPRAWIEGIPNVDRRHGTGRAELMGIAVLDGQGDPATLLEPTARALVRISVRAKDELLHPAIGFTLRNHLGIDFAGTNTSRQHVELRRLRPGDLCTVDFDLELPELYPAFFSFSAGISDGPFEPASACDWIENAVTVQVTASGNPVYGYLHLPCRVELNTPSTVTEASLD